MVKILSWNVAGVGSASNFPFRAKTIRDYLRRDAFDIVALTEFGTGKSSEFVANNLTSSGMKIACAPNTTGARDNILLAARSPFEIVNCRTRWLETYHPHIDLHLLTIHIPDKTNELKSKFWHRVLKHAEANRERRALIVGDFNSCAPEDSHTGTPYSPKQLRKLNEHGWIDCWQKFATERDNHQRFTWSKGMAGFRIDYAFISPTTTATVNIRHDHSVRKSQPGKEGFSDHAAISIEIA